MLSCIFLLDKLLLQIVKRIILFLTLVLGTVAALRAQEAPGPWLMSAEMIVGAGVDNGPQTYSSATFTAGYKFGNIFLVGAGAGLRFALPLKERTYLESLPTIVRDYQMEWNLPIYLRLGLEGRKWFVHVDGGYAVGVVGLPWPGSKGAPARVATCYKGFFVDPHAGIILGGHHAIGLGVLLQQSTYQERVSTRSGDVVSTSVNTMNAFPLAINLRYGFRF